MGRQELLQSIATTIGDYRKGEIPTPDPAHVDRWVGQFEAPVQEPILMELDHVLRQTYLSRQFFVDFLRNLVRLKQVPGLSGFWHQVRTVLAGLLALLKPARVVPAAGRTFWRNVNFLDIQRHGASQHEMLALFEEVLKENHGLTLARCGSPSGGYLYLDDILFTGNRIILDLCQWIQTVAPPRARVVVVVIACYRRGLWYTHKTILQAAVKARKTIRVSWLRATEFEDRQWLPGGAEVFAPAHLPDAPPVVAYAEELARAGYPPRLRIPDRAGNSRLFSSETGRHLLEQQLLLAGLKIRSFCRNPQEVMRPLGYHTLKSLGFGSTVVTYRNCPNNCPLAWWWGDSAAPRSHPLGRWYPLFPRKV
ncbi:MAG: hypothetical protein HYS12_09480 [Planctomycetes bacterium]|nr:hypothetical protein [Planctomycetota bacterium]